MNDIKYNTKGYKILTPRGYKDFKGISYNGKKEIWKVTLENGMFIEASEDHKFYINNNPRKLKDLHLECMLETIEDPSKIVSIENTKRFEDTYDILHIDNTKHTFFGNGIETSNCKFLGSAQTLVDPDLLERIGVHLQNPIDLKYNGALKVYEPPQENTLYILGVDSATGNGGDYSVIQVLKIEDEHNITQVAVFSDNLMSYAKFAEAVIGISEYYNGCYIMLENNDIGAQVANSIWNDFEYDKIINVEKKQLGIRSTRKSKLAANMLLKRYLESGWLDLKDDETLRQLTMYEEVSPNVYRAPASEHDDYVTSLLWGLYFVNTIYFDAKDLSIKTIDPRFKIEQRTQDDVPVIFDNAPTLDDEGFDWGSTY
jgi:hypothetical protein